MEKAREAEVSWALRHLGIFRDTRLRGSAFPKSGHWKCCHGNPEGPAFSSEFFPPHLLLFLGAAVVTVPETTVPPSPAIHNPETSVFGAPPRPEWAGPGEGEAERR